MRVLVIGSGGREHALCWAIAASPLLTKLWCAPGNPGIAQVAECVPIGVMDFPALVAFAQDNEIDLVVPGPEAPLVAGIADAMEAASIPCIGPSRQAAQLEGSKAFTKELCDAAGIPTAQWERFDDAEAAREFVRRRGAPTGGEGGRPRRRQSRRCRRDRRGGACRHRRDDGCPRLRRRRRLGGDRGMPARRGGFAVRALRRHHRAAVRRRAGPQARRRG